MNRPHLTTESLPIIFWQCVSSQQMFQRKFGVSTDYPLNSLALPLKGIVPKNYFYSCCSNHYDLASNKMLNRMFALLFSIQYWEQIFKLQKWQKVVIKVYTTYALYFISFGLIGKDQNLSCFLNLYIKQRLLKCVLQENYISVFLLQNV